MNDTIVVLKPFSSNVMITVQEHPLKDQYIFISNEYLTLYLEDILNIKDNKNK